MAAPSIYDPAYSKAMIEMTAKTNAERQEALRQSRRTSGLKEVRNLWCHPDDELAIRQHAAKLQAKREKGLRKP
jgi:hypothetical protein